METDIVWMDDAQSDLAEIWMDRVAHRNRITRSADELEEMIAADPEGAGESREEEDRVVFVGCLKVRYYYDAERKVAIVLGVEFNRGRA